MPDQGLGIDPVKMLLAKNKVVRFTRFEYCAGRLLFMRLLSILNSLRFVRADSWTGRAPVTLFDWKDKCVRATNWEYC